MATPVADLHVHTTASDGQLTPAEIPDAARAVGLEVVAVTDHDRIHPDLDAPVTVRDGVTVVRGVELRADAGEFRVDLLGYGVSPSADLTAELDRVQRDRVQRATRMIDCLESRLGVDIDLDPRPGVGRPHIARAVAASPADYDVEGAFRHLIGADGPCYVPRDVPPFERAVDLLASSCALVSLAHPFRYPDPDAALALAADSDAVDAVERYYPYGRGVDTDRLDRIAADNEMLSTGGSDAHGTELGAAGLDPAAYRPIATRLPGTQA